MIIEGYDPFFESIRLNFGENSGVEQRWDKLFNNVGSLVKKYECIEDYRMGIYRLCFYLNNGRGVVQEVEMNYGHYSYAESLLVDIANKIEDKICREGQTHYDYWTLLDDQKLGRKREWEAKWDSAKDTLNKKYGYLDIADWKIDERSLTEATLVLRNDKEDKIMVKPEHNYIADRMVMMPKIKDVIFNNPATIVKWADGTKTVVKVQKGEPYDEEKGLAMAFIKKVYANKGNYNDIFRKWCPKKEIPKVDDFNGTVEEMFEDDFECESCKINL